MHSLLGTRSALLLALRTGPGYGRELIRQVRRTSAGRAPLSEARVYPVLRALEQEGLVESRVSAPGGRRGARARTYYDLTVRGVQASSRELAALRALVEPGTGPRIPAASQNARMVSRLFASEMLAASGVRLSAAMAAARRRRRR